MVQEVFARMYATPGIERQTASAYIFRAAANLVNDRARREAVRAAYHQTSPDARIELVENRDPERIIAGRQAWAGIRRVLETLPERTRVIFVLFRLEGMARKDIASHFGISVSAVEKHIANAMQALMRAREEWS